MLIICLPTGVPFMSEFFPINELKISATSTEQIWSNVVSLSTASLY